MTQTDEPPNEPTPDHTEAEATLRESEERFRATFEQAAVGIVHVSPEGRFLRINQAFCGLVGYTHDEMLARTFQEITHPWELRTVFEAKSRYFEPVFVFRTTRRVGLVEVMPITIAARAEPELPDAQPA